MAKRIIVLIFISLAFALWQGTELFNRVVAQKKRGAPKVDYSKFKHSTHEGVVKSLIIKNQNYNLDCAYCHGDAVKDKLGKDRHDIGTIGYPSHKNGVGSEMVHSACDDCHAFTGSAIERPMCTICHDKLTFNQQEMKTNLRRFTNPDGGGISQFYDYYSHSEHKDYYASFILQTPLKDKMKFYDPKKDAKANRGLDKDKFECMTCHVMTPAPVTVGKIEFKPGVKMSAPSHPECWICHFDPKIVPPPKKDKPDPKNTFATNCAGCHRPTGAPLNKSGRPVKGSELAPLWFSRLIVNNELNPLNPGEKPQLPYSHKTHDKNRITEEPIFKNFDNYCLACHVTGKTAATLSDFYLEDRKTKENQPSANNCAACHEHQKDMAKKIGGAVTIQSAKCDYCHSLQTVRLFESRGVQLPPPNHFYKQPTPGPTLAMNMAPAPEPKKPVPVPAPTPVVEATPEPPKIESAPTPTPAATVQVTTPEPKQPEPQPAATVQVTTPEPKQPEPQPAPAPPATTPEPKQPEPQPAPTPAPVTTPEPSETKTAPEPTTTPAPTATVAATPPAETAPTPKTEPTPAPPKPEPAPTPAPAPAATTVAAAPTASAGGSVTVRGIVYKVFPGKGMPQTEPKLPRLGDPKDNPHWGLDEQWGVVENFDHQNHTQPKYSKSCEECHHSNNDTRADMAAGMVPNCVFCHKEKGHPENPKNSNGDEIDVRWGYHGNETDTGGTGPAALAGCIQCHKRYYEANPDAERLAPTSRCAGCHIEKTAWLDDRRRPAPRRFDRLVQLFDMIRGSKERDQVRIAARR
jgi:Class III cytochrome C family